ncbi:hypothetical protein BT96DRAFT_1000562 [Gymnopus androsaceus JB14]|uniref:F-box domain-containing protein n=1 Tax=Gymnopus androsaceus JB14 TaxID=1447944 RepID=A0A6A4H225_9AGAR|nr:hypothetical protein BT96DRAFT_1000562 [Gymnopus androsaceus JB14]
MSFYSTQSPFLRLPPEILCQIIDFCPKSSLVVLCRVSKTVGEFSVRSLYRDISFKNASVFIKCCYALVKVDLAAASVKYLRIDFDGFFGQSRYLLSAFYHLVSKVLCRLHNLQGLKILHDEPGYQSALQSCHFSRLSYFQTSLPLTRPLTDFLTRHSSTISVLYLDGRLPDPSSASTSTAPSAVNLPVLTSFTGNPAFVRFVVQKQDTPMLRSAHMTAITVLELPEAQVIQAVEHLRDVAGETLETVAVLGRGFSSPLSRYASMHLTSVKSLGLMHLTRLLVDDEDVRFSTERLCEEVKLLLPPLQQLQRLIISRTIPPVENKVLTLAEGHKTVTTFNSICPNLEFVRLPDDTEWTRIIPGFVNLWIPEVSRIANIESAWWLLDMLGAESRRNPEWKSVLRSVLSGAGGWDASSGDPEGDDDDDAGEDAGAVASQEGSSSSAVETLFGLIDKRLRVVENASLES